MLRYRLLIAALVGALALVSSACTQTSSCDRDEDLIHVQASDGVIDRNTYYSSKFGGPYLYFPPARTYDIELGGFKDSANPNALPSVQFWLAFSPQGTLAPSAGNMTELRVADADADHELALTSDRISVRNNTCSDFYLWVVATLPASCSGECAMAAEEAGGTGGAP